MGRTDAALVVAAREGENAAFAELFDRWFDRCFDVARNIVRNDDHAADVAQDVFLTAWQRLDQLGDPERFGGWLLRISRNKALNRLQKEGRRRPTEGSVMTDLHDRNERDDLVGSNRVTDTEDISEIRARQELVWAAAAGLGVREASILDLHLRHHLGAAEIADELDITANNAHQLLYRLRQKLGDVIGNHQLWRDGRPRCSVLADLAIDEFDEAGNRSIQRHRSSCDTCSAEHRAVVDPQKLFAAVPIAVAPLAMRSRAASALEASGVPVRSAAGSGGGESGPDGPASGESGTGESGSGGAGSDGAGPIDPDRQPTRPRSASRAVLAGSAVVAAVVAVAFLLARPAGDPALDVAVPASTTTPPTTAAPTTAAPTTTPPTTAAPTTAVPTTEAPTTEPPETQPPVTRPVDPAVPAPEIIRFSVSDPVGISLRCTDDGEIPRRAVWSVDGADELLLDVGGEIVDITTAEQHLFCAVPGTDLRLTATNPSGSVDRVIQA